MIVSAYGIISTNCDGMSLRSLQLNLQRLRGGEQQTRKRRAKRIPSAEDRRRERDESAARRHLRAELMLVEREIGAAERREHAGERRREISNACHVDSDRDRRRGMFARPLARATQTACDTAATPSTATATMPSQISGLLSERTRTRCPTARRQSRARAASSTSCEMRAAERIASRR